MENMPDLSYHVYPAYHKHDLDSVTCILTFLKAQGFVVFDPLYDIQLGRLKLQNIVENGICVCQNTIIFLSPDFINDGLCEYTANVAVTRQLQNKKNKVFAITIRRCNVPAHLQCLFRVDLEECSHDDAMKLVLRELECDWSSADLTSSHECEELSDEKTVFEAVIDQIKGADCTLRCRYGRCNFVCSGKDHSFLSKHLEKCSFYPVQCSFRSCNLTYERRSIKKHREECQYRLVPCPHNTCHEHFPAKVLRSHELRCKRRPIHCKNRQMGCPKIVECQKLKSHLKKCAYKTVVCSECNVHVLKRDISEHDCPETRRIADFFSNKDFDFQEKSVTLPRISHWPDQEHSKRCEKSLHVNTNLEHDRHCREKENFQNFPVSQKHSILSSSKLDDYRGQDEHHNTEYRGPSTNGNFLQTPSSRHSVQLSRRLCGLRNMTLEDLLELLSDFPGDNRIRITKQFFS